MATIIERFHDLDQIIDVDPVGFSRAEEVIKYIKQRSYRVLGSHKVDALERRDAFDLHWSTLAVCLALFKHGCPVPKWVRMLYGHWEILFHSDKDPLQTCRCSIAVWVSGLVYLYGHAVGTDVEACVRKVDYRQLADKVKYICLANSSDK